MIKSTIKYFTVCKIFGCNWTHMSNGHSCCCRCTALGVLSHRRDDRMVGPVTRDQFVTEWLQRSGLRFLPSNRFPMPCSCCGQECTGWSMEYVE